MSSNRALEQLLRVTIVDMIKPAARYPADPRAVFILAFSVFTGATALAVSAAPQTMNSLLPPWFVFLWNLLLVLGSITTLAGMASQSIWGILTEQVGSVMVATTTLFYSTIAFWYIGVDAIQPVGIVAAWGLACAIRWFQLQRLIAQTLHEQTRRDAVRSIGGDPNALEDDRG